MRWGGYDICDKNLSNSNERKREVMKRKHLILCIAAALLLSLIVVGNTYAADGPDYLCLTAVGGRVDFYLEKVIMYENIPCPEVSLEYSFNGVDDWADFEIKSEDSQGFVAYNLNEEGTLYLRAGEGGNTSFGAGEDNNFDDCNYYKFVVMEAEGGGNIELSGNIMSLLNADCRSTELPDYAFTKLFWCCENITSIGDLELPETRLGKYCYEDMFNGTGITEIPNNLLPATTLKDGCYKGMFCACPTKNLPALKATKLADYCYEDMFNSCIKLTEIPKGFLPATQLAKACYRNMFSYCHGIIKIPEGLLPAIQLTEFCYSSMFFSCDGIKEIPKDFLPATRLAELCYSSMFNNCDGITTIPEGLLPATRLAESCYSSMFEGCDGIKKISEGLLPATQLAESCYSSMFSDCNGITEIPEGLLPATQLADRCYDGMFRICRKLLNVPETLLPAKKLAPYCYSEMFKQCGELKNIPDLPATQIAEHCYENMFNDCRALEDFIEELPATTLADYCYSNMFARCRNITKAPKLPATQLADHCYDQMFFQCGNITKAPELPAMIMKPYCYWHMFEGAGLTATPNLPATTLAESCYEAMFSSCYPLEQATALPATIMQPKCYSYMFAYCENLKSSFVLPATELVNGCYSNMFDACQNLGGLAVFFTDWNENAPVDFQEEWTQPTEFWVSSVNNAASFEFYCPGELNVNTKDISHVLSNWQINPCYITNLKFVDTNGGDVNGASILLEPSYVLLKDIESNPTIKIVEVVTPDGYEFKSISVINNSTGDAITVTDNAFVMPDSDVTITAEFKKLNIIPFIPGGTGSNKPVVPTQPTTYDKCKQDELCPLTNYYDLDATKWYHDGIHFCLDNGLMNGIGSYTFDPDGTTTRAMMMTILARMDGCDTEGGEEWYSIGMSWAKNNGISDGTLPLADITREQFAAMLYRYAKLNGRDTSKDIEDTNTLSYNDIFDVSNWATEGVHWCLASGIFRGKTINGVEGFVDPQGLLTRAEAAAMIQRYFELK